METEPRRPFRILDLMVLVAAVAAGFGWLRLHKSLYLDPLGSEGFSPFYVLQNFWQDGSLYLITVWAPYFLSPLTLAVFLLGGRHCRGAWRAWLRESGASACAVMALIFGVVGVIYLACGLLWVKSTFADVIYAFLGSWGVVWSGGIGVGVLSVWAIQSLSGHWQPRRDWLDRVGRTLGVAWIIVSLVDIVRHSRWALLP